MASRPPFYVLVAHHSTSQPPSSNNLRHPAIQYHYADDSPLAVLPQHPAEHVLVLNHADPVPTARSVSDGLIVTGLKVEEAPGAAAASAEESDGKNDRMFIIETLKDERPPTPPHEERKSANAILAQFKRRNQMIRDALRYPSDSKQLNSTLSDHTVLDA